MKTLNYPPVGKLRGAKLLEKFKTISPKKISDSSDAYFLFLENWDEYRLDDFKEAKAILLNKSGEAFAISGIPVDKENMKLESDKPIHLKLASVLAQARKQNAHSIIIGESALPSTILADDEKIKIVRHYKNLASAFDIKLEDYISMTGMSYSSFKRQKLLNL